MTIRLPGKVTGRSFEEPGLLPEVSTLIRSRSDGVTLDFGNTSFVDVSGLVFILSCLGGIQRIRKEHGQPVLPIVVSLPDGPLKSYLNHMHFFRTANIHGLLMSSDDLAREEKVAVGLVRSRVGKSTRDNLTGSTYMPLRYIPSSSSMRQAEYESACGSFINDLIDEFSDVVFQHVDLGDEGPLKLWQPNKEVHENIYHHSGSWGIIGIQVYPSTISIACGDGGIGIKESLCTGGIYRKHATDAGAIRLAVRKGVTRLKDSRGLGLYYVTEYIKRCDGALFIRSGYGRLAVTSKEERYFTSDTFSIGTQIWLQVPRKKT